MVTFSKISRGGTISVSDMARFLRSCDKDKNGYLDRDNGEVKKASRSRAWSGRKINSELSYALVMRGAGRNWHEGMTAGQLEKLRQRYGR